MNPRHAANGALYGLQASRGVQSAFAHDLLAGLEALVLEQDWRSVWTGGNDEQWICELCDYGVFDYTAVAWKRVG